MQNGQRFMYVPNPDASLVEVGTGDNAGKVIFNNGEMTIVQASVTTCEKQCAQACTPQVWHIVFKNVDFENCNPCAKQVGFNIKLQRNALFDNETYLQWTQGLMKVYGGQKNGVVTAATFADYFKQIFDDANLYNGAPNNFFITATIATTNVADDTLVLEVPCPFKLDGIYNIEDNNLLVAETQDFTLITAGQDSIYSRDELLMMAPLHSEYIPGSRPQEYFLWCQTICKVVLRGCIDACDEEADGNLVQLGHAAQRFELGIWVNSDHPGFEAFITALNTAFTNCTLDLVTGSKFPRYSDATGGGSAVIDLSEVDFTNPKNFLVSNGAVNLEAIGATSIANLAALLTTIYPAGTFTANPTDITVTGSFLTTATGAEITFDDITDPLPSSAV